MKRENNPSKSYFLDQKNSMYSSALACMFQAIKYMYIRNLKKKKGKKKEH